MFENKSSIDNKLSWVLDIVLCLLFFPLIGAAISGIRHAIKTYRPLKKENNKTPQSIKLEWEDFRIAPGNDEKLLDGWFIKCEGSKNTVIVAHELGVNKNIKLRYAKFLHAQGYNVLLFDLRNHGASFFDSALSSMSDRFTDDIQAVVKYVRNRPELKDGHVGILSFSFSTFPTLYVLQREDCDIDAVIFDSGPALDIPKMYKNYMNVIGHYTVFSLYKGPIVFEVVKYFYRIFVFRMLGVTWPPQINAKSTKMLFVASKNDPIIEPEDSKRFLELYPNAKFWTAPNSTHLLGFIQDKKEYIEVVGDFLKEAFSVSGVKNGSAKVFVD